MVIRTVIQGLIQGRMLPSGGTIAITPLALSCSGRHMSLLAHIWVDQEAEKDRKCDPSPTESLPSAMSRIPKVPQASKTALLVKDQRLKHMILWGTLLKP